MTVLAARTAAGSPAGPRLVMVVWHPSPMPRRTRQAAPESKGPPVTSYLGHADHLVRVLLNSRLGADLISGTRTWDMVLRVTWVKARFLS